MSNARGLIVGELEAVAIRFAVLDIEEVSGHGTLRLCGRVTTPTRGLPKRLPGSIACIDYLG
jgi:hypothetical protein